MKNSLVCKNCQTENPFYGLICTNCKSFLREKIFNIDLWKVLGLLVDDPKKAFGIIIQSEHKNFIFFITAFVAGKFYIDSMLLSLATSTAEPVFNSIFTNYFGIFTGTLALVFILALAFTFLNSLFSLKTRIKDNFAVLTYSLVPHVYGLILLFTIEVTVFGGNLFSRNPSPFDLKTTLAYLLTGFEALIILWSIFLSFMGMLAQTKNLIYSALTSLAFNAAIYYSIYLNSINLFK